jgi:hypothetical protein
MERANHYGADGWELINYQLRDNADGVFITAMLKRPL